MTKNSVILMSNEGLKSVKTLQNNTDFYSCES